MADVQDTVEALRRALQGSFFSQLEGADRDEVIAQLTYLCNENAAHRLEEIGEMVDDRWYRYGLGLLSKTNIEPAHVMDLLETRRDFQLLDDARRHTMIIEGIFAICHGGEGRSDAPWLVESKQNACFKFVIGQDDGRTITIEDLQEKLQH